MDWRKEDNDIYIQWIIFLRKKKKKKKKRKKKEKERLILPLSNLKYLDN